VADERKFFKTRIEVVVISRDPIEGVTLLDIDHMIDEGDAAGNWGHVDSKELTPQEAVEALKEIGSEPDFFNMDEYGNDIDLIDDLSCAVPTEDYLDEAVHDAMSNTAANINNRGIVKQVSFLISELGDVAVRELIDGHVPSPPRETPVCKTCPGCGRTIGPTLTICPHEDCRVEQTEVYPADDRPVATIGEDGKVTVLDDDED